MNAAKMTLVSTVVAAAFGLALGLAPAPAEAHHCKGGHAIYPECDGGGGGFTVDMVVGLMGPEGGMDECMGRTNSSNLSARFGPGCSVTMDDDLVLNLFQASVRTKKNGMTDIDLFFTEEELSDTVFTPILNDIVYNTDRLDALIVLGVSPGFELRLIKAVDVDLIKTSPPGKGEMVGQIEVGSFFYSPE